MLDIRVFEARYHDRPIVRIKEVRTLKYEYVILHKKWESLCLQFMSCLKFESQCIRHDFKCSNINKIRKWKNCQFRIDCVGLPVRNYNILFGLIGRNSEYIFQFIEKKKKSNSRYQVPA